MKKTLGGDRLGSGKKIKVDLHGYERSTHDLGYVWRSTMSAGTLVPFLNELALPGDTFDIDLDVDIKTHPTIGPLFGSYKVQLDIFQCPIRLYQGKLHNNKLGIGNHMAEIKLPVMTLFADASIADLGEDPDNAQINPSCILSYLGIRGVGNFDVASTGPQPRDFHALSLLSYWDIYKNYYANKQEEIGYVIHKDIDAIINTVTSVTIGGTSIPQAPNSVITGIYNDIEVVILFTGAQPQLTQILINTSLGQLEAETIASGIVIVAGTSITFHVTGVVGTAYSWEYISSSSLPVSSPTPMSFPLSDLDIMREEIMVWTNQITAFNVMTTSVPNLQPFAELLTWVDNQSPYKANQEGLALKTYNSDLFNNWLSTEWLDGVDGINEITAVDTSGGSFTIDTLNLSKKVYDMLNRIAVSGGSYDDWLDVVYDHERYTRAETPIYQGGMSSELVFQEVVSNSVGYSDISEDVQPLGTLAGKGIMSKGRNKGGHVIVKVDEPSYIMGIISLTPRIDYSQGNKWDVHLKTMDDLHKPALDEIGFQELITEQMAWWTTRKFDGDPVWHQRSAGKQPAWINYMTNVNVVKGNFAIKTNEMFMTLNRRYEWNGQRAGSDIIDLTTYIDPVKYNQIFAQTALDAQNFWAQIAVNITARRKMSAKVMPNL